MLGKGESLLLLHDNVNTYFKLVTQLSNTSQFIERSNYSINRIAAKLLIHEKKRIYYPHTTKIFY